jgi:methylated-DNA-[protein]-cysteine S-methyltransferase
MHRTALAIDTLDTPLGRYVLRASERGLTGIAPARSGETSRVDVSVAARRQLERARAALAAYFAGTRRSFDDLELAAEGTPFQQRVWAALARVPFGATLSYGELARRIDRAGAARAVGAANGHNPLAIVVPCHRIVGADGALTGYAHGVERKRWLLAHEATQATSKISCSASTRAHSRRRASAVTSI